MIRNFDIKDGEYTSTIYTMIKGNKIKNRNITILLAFLEKVDFYCGQKFNLNKHALNAEEICSLKL